jgi:hypothetical protein
LRRKRRRRKKAVPVDNPRGIPADVAEQALIFGHRNAKLCDTCQGYCRCGLYQYNIWMLMDWKLRNWEQQRLIALCRRIPLPKQPIEPPTNLGTRMLIEDAERPPSNRRPESSGFEIDHQDGERWRRFK